MKALKYIIVTFGIIWTLIASIITVLCAFVLLLTTIWLRYNITLNLILIVFSKTLKTGLFPLGFIYAISKVIISKEARRRELSKYFRKVAIADDQKGNVVMSYLFNDVLIQENGYLFGDEDETLSSAMGRNEKQNTFKKLGGLLNRILNVFQENHTVLAIEHEEDGS